MITYREIKKVDLKDVKRLYAECGWTAYLQDDARLSDAWDRSLYALGAFDGEALVGFVRCLGDGAHTVLVQDLIVKEAYHRRGIGKELMQAVFMRFQDVRQVFVVTDSEAENLAFYRACGMKPLRDGNMTAFFR